MKANIVIGLGFGDEGKGRTVDYLCSLYEKDSPNNTIVVRFSGGHQVGHTVMKKDGDKEIKHIFSNFGSGSLRNVPTYYSEFCTMYPTTMVTEYLTLAEKNIEPIFYLHPLTMITTPYDVAYNRAVERVRGEHCKHGTVGLGFGATIDRNLNTGYKLFAQDLEYSQHNIFKSKVDAIKKYYHNEKINSSNLRNIYFLELEKLEDIFFKDVEFKPYRLNNYEYLLNYKNLVFEGSQGVLLDMNHGFFPNVTYSNTTTKNALEIINKIPGNISPEISYVTRCYQTRHGVGFMSDESNIELINNEHETCGTNIYQGELRIGELDYDMIKYALDVDLIYSGNIRKSLFITCLDQRPDFTFKNELLKKYGIYSYKGFDTPYNY